MRRRLSILALAAVACGGALSVRCSSASSCAETRTCDVTTDGGGGKDAGGSFSVSPSEPSVTLVENGSVSIGVVVGRTGNATPVVIDAIELPSGVSAAPVTASPTQNSVQIALSAGAGASHGEVTIKVR